MSAAFEHSFPTRMVALTDIVVRKRARALRSEAVTVLAESMRDSGLINPITLRPIADGRYGLIAGFHRLDAANRLRWPEIQAIILDGVDAIDAELYEIDENLIRADLTDAEKAAHHTRRKDLYQQKYPETKSGQAGRGRGKLRQIGEANERYTADTAKKTGGSERSIQRHVERGNKIPNVSELAGTSLDHGVELDALADLPKDVQAELIEKARKGEKVSAKAEAKKLKREAREAELGEAQAAGNLKFPDRHYGVILVDWPRKPWAYSDETGADRSPANHYAVHDFAWAINVMAPMLDKLAALDCMLAFWSTAASLIDDIEIMTEAGFCALRPRGEDGRLLRDEVGAPLAAISAGGGSYRSHQVWDKQAIGLGRWFRDRHEILLIGVRGNFPAPTPGTQSASIFNNLKGEHSAKPEFIAEEIERLWPNLPKIELFRRGQPRVGWDGWGAECADAEAGEIAEAAE